MNVIVRAMQVSDIPEVVSIENSWSFLSKWGEGGYQRVLQDPGIYACFVAENLDRESDLSRPILAGLAVLAILIDFCELCNLIVHPAYLSKKVGYRLLRSCLEIARQKGVPKMFLEVRTSNMRAIEFYKANGFQVVSKRKNYYRDPTEDAWIMERRDPGSKIGLPNPNPLDWTGQPI
ncbi:MAG TPA: GNAT family N-acetyltransferase [Terriglobia bacterium]|nr:GNAT family N-acetyltransferase [Terriglobia bacterium]